MSTAFLDTTVLTNALLKSSALGREARRAIGSYERSELPVYAIKEFKAGPLTNFVWMHNKLAETGSLAEALSALQRMSRTPKRYLVSTAIEALQEAMAELADMTTGDLIEKYGHSARLDAVQCDQYRLAIKAKVYSAWKRKDQLCTEVVQPLDCYLFQGPTDERGLVSLKPTKCSPHPECCLAPQLKAAPDVLKLLRDAVEFCEPQNAEHQRRAKVLRELERKPKSPMTESMCRDLGDAYFAFFSPPNAVVVTTNLRDHEPLARAVGKPVVRPAE